MRNAFRDRIHELAKHDDRIVILSADIGNRMFDAFKADFPDRFYNVGVAEQNMIGTAAGLAMSGFRPVCYTIASFITYRAIEQIRVDLCYHDLPVTVVGCGAGLAYASLGATHHACEDIAMMRVLPNMAVLCPGDAAETRGALDAALTHDHPVYLRIGKKGEPDVHPPLPAPPPKIAVGKSLLIREGHHACILSTGNTLPIAVEASQKLRNRGISTRVVSAYSVKPLDTLMLSDALHRYPLVATVEEHANLGGLGSATAEWLADHPHPNARLLRLGLDDQFPHQAGSQDDTRKRLGLDPDTLADRIRETLTYLNRRSDRAEKAIA